MSQLRITDTNSANDNKGRALGLDGNDFLYVLGGFVVGLGLYLVFAFLLRIAMLVALMFALPAFIGPVAWAVFFRHNKPEGYAEDVCDDLVNGEGWSLATAGQPRAPGKDRHAQ